MYDKYDEVVNEDVYGRIENFVGVFFEYNYDNLEKLNLMVGVCVDNSNVFGFFVMFRLYVKYIFWEKFVLCFLVGSGRRSVNIFIENQQLFFIN